MSRTDGDTADNAFNRIVNRLGVGGVTALAVGAMLTAGVTAVGAANGADDGISATPVTASVASDDDGTPDQGRGDAPGTPGATSTTVTSTTASSTTTVATTAAPAAPRRIPVPGVGEVVIDETPLRLLSATPANGFTVRTEATAREIHVRFFDARGGRIDVQVEIENGAPRIRVRDRRVEDDRRGRDGSSTTVGTAPTTTIDDHGGRTDRDDRDESGDDRDDRDDRDDDNSGPGSGDDDRDDRDDDNSGRGSGDDRDDSDHSGRG